MVDSPGATPSPLPPRFDLIRELGSGGMGIVYEAFDRELSRRVAAKVFHDRSLDTADRIKREFRVAAAVSHPGLVRLGELFEHDDSLCFSMELIEGQSLAAWVGAPPARFVRVRTALRQLAAALAAVHGAGVVHRDVKPSNILVAAGDRIVLLDLGLAVHVDRHDRELAGTVEYIAPEQVGGRPARPPVDLYGLGVVAFELLTGRTPFEGAPLEVLVAKTERDAPSAQDHADVPDDLAQLTAAMLARDPAARPTAAELVALLGEPGPGHRRARRSSRSHRRELFGRADELAALLAASEEPARRDRTTLFLVRGGPGVGKTALLDAFARAASARGHLVCAGRCAPREHLRWNAWEALLDGLARHLAGLPADERAALLPHDAEVLTRLFPSFARVAEVRGVRSDSVDELIAAGVAALRTLLRLLAGTRRVISILDDAQWATGASFELLLDVLARPSPPCLVLFCVRTASGQTAGVDRLNALRKLPIDLRVLDLGPLPDADAIALATQLTGDAELGRVLGLAAHGNPLFVEQLATDPAHGVTDVATWLAGRIAALTPEQERVLRMVAAAGTAIGHERLGQALGMPHETVAHVLEQLADRLLVRLTGLLRTDASEPLHDRVVEATRAAAGDPGLRAEHRALALAHADDVALRVVHWIGAGDGDRAALAAIEAVDRARDGLDFARALGLCDRARTLPAPSHGARLARRRADALAGSGDGARAAQAYADAADAATGDDALDLERLAAEHFLRSGRIEDGLARARRVSSALGFELATGAGRMLGRIAVERLRNRWRGVELAGAASDADGHAADACYSLSIGLSMIDTVRAAWFTSRGVRLALASGDPARGARALGLEAALLAARGGKIAPRARDTLAHARALAARSGDRRGLALAEHSAAAVDLLLGDFRASRRHADQAIALFKDGVAGVAFEQHTAAFFGIVAAYWLGEWSDATRRTRALVRTADATGDRFARVCATTGVAVVGELVAGIAADVLRTRVAESAELWPREQVPSAHMRELSAAAMIDLYHGEPGAAADRLERAWPFLARTRSLEVEQARATLIHLRARARLRLGRLEEALADARTLRAVRWMIGPAALIEAAVMHARGRDPALALDEAVRACEEAGLAAIAAAARDRRARVAGGDAGAAEQLEARDQAARLGLGPPERAFALLAPWPAAP